MYAPVAVDAATGARRNELLAFRWTDLDVEKKALRVERVIQALSVIGYRRRVIPYQPVRSSLGPNLGPMQR